jgi:hypothetical protein
MANEEKMLCPTCKGPLAYVRELTREESQAGISGGGGRISLPLDSHISRCQQHGLWRVYISGHAAPFKER